MAMSSEVLDKKFDPVGQVSVDDKNRVVLKKAIDMVRRQFGEGSQSQLRFAVACNSAGQILLSPETAIPLHEVWLYRNKEALESVHRGIREAKQGKLGKKLPSFTKHADDEIE